MTGTAQGYRAHRAARASCVSFSTGVRTDPAALANR